MKKYSIGADIGGSHISCAVIDLENKYMIKNSLVHVAVDNHGLTEDIIHSWKTALEMTIKFIDIKLLEGIGFAMPGHFDYTNGIGLFKGNSKYENLFGVNVGMILRKSMSLNENIEFRFMNDATAFAVAGIRSNPTARR